MYKCSSCGATMYQPKDLCPSCGISLRGVKCQSCGHTGSKVEFINNNHHCPKCDTYVPFQEVIPTTITPTLPPLQMDNQAFFSMLLGFFSFAFVFLLASVPAVIMGHKALKRLNSQVNPLKGKTMAIIGLILGYTNIVVFIFFVVIIFSTR